MCKLSSGTFELKCMITVLLPVKNGEKYIRDAVDSVLGQTFTHFELLIIDDQSDDRTVKILDSYTDSRIKVVRSRLGFIGNLNYGIEHAQGQYIARMDSDDVMNPDRLKIQYRIMITTDTDICGSWVKIFGSVPFEYLSHYNYTGRIDNPLQELVYTNFLAHPSVMLKKSFLINNSLRYENYPCAEDYKLWFEAAKKNAVFYVEPQPLLRYRITKDQVTKRAELEMKKYAAIISEQIREYLDLETNENTPGSLR